MSAKSILAELKKMGTAQNRKIYARHGAQEPMFGVSYANLGQLTKRIQSDHNLALELWDSGVHDARVLATMIANPTAAKASEINAWTKGVNSSIVADALASFVAKTKYAEKKASLWSKSPRELRAIAGWRTLTHLAVSSDLPDAFFEPYLDVIAEDIHRRQNKVRDAMNSTLIAIGCRNAKLEKKALAVAKAVGKVEVDHGQTSCKTPDAATYIRKTRAHYAAKKKTRKASAV